MNETEGGRVRRYIRTHRRKTVAGLVAFVLAISAGALAAWMVSATGTGTAKLGTLQAPTINAAAVDPGQKQCFPSQTCDARAGISNPNSGTLYAVAVEASAPNAGVCGQYILANPHAISPGVAVASGTANYTVPDAFTLAPEAPSSCQGATETANLKLQFSTSP